MVRNEEISAEIEKFWLKFMEVVNQLVNFAPYSHEKKNIKDESPFGDYFKKFKRTLKKQTINKIYQILLYIMTLDIIPQTYMKSITGVSSLFDIRVDD